MDIFKILERDPDQGIEIHDDGQAISFLRAIGIADAFAPVHSLSDVPTVQICGFDGIKTHYILAFLFSGCARKSENGYQVFCAPRSGFEPGLSAGDFVSGAAADPKLRGLRVMVRNEGNRESPKSPDSPNPVEEQFLKMLSSTWGATTLESLRLESDKITEGGAWRAIRKPDGSRKAIMACVTRPEIISLLEKKFLLIDDGQTVDWNTTTMLDLLMSARDQGHGFSFQRDEMGRRSALMFVALTPDSVAFVEQIFCLKPN